MDPHQSALGMIETWGFPALIAAADAAAKTADVKVKAYEKADAGLVTVYIWGDVASVKAAVDAGAAAAAKVGKLISAHVIPRPDSEIAAMLQPPPEKEHLLVLPSDTGAQRAAALQQPQSQPPFVALPSDLGSLSVQELRRLAHSKPGFPLSRSQISAAGKEVLIRLLTEQNE
jgi:microcompartment protein CcmL/EutN